MLMHHSDSKCIGVIGVVDFNLPAIDFDLSLLRLIQAEQNTHEGGFAGSVFSQQRVDFALFNLQRHIVVGFKAAKPFCDIVHLNYIVHAVPPFLSVI